VFVVSMVAHAWFVAVVFVALSYHPEPPPPARSVIDTTVGAQVELELMDEVQIFPAKVVPLPVPPSAPPARPGPAPSVVKGPPSPTGNAAPPAPPSIRRMLHRPAMPGQSVVYVLDRSASMGEQGRFAMATAYLLDTLRATAAGVRVQVVLYNRTAEYVLLGGAAGMVELTPSRLGEVEAKLASLFAEGTSSHVVGLRSALALEPAAVFLLTDADDLRESDVQRINETNRERCSIHTVRFAVAGDRLANQSSLMRLARANRGTAQLIAVP